MRCLIISDSHGNSSALAQIFEKEKTIDKVMFLGDGLADMSMIKNCFPKIELDVVRGNCDINLSIPPMQILTLCDQKVMLCHGDGFGVKTSLLALRRVAISMEANIVLYGHTHKQYYEYMDGLYIFCPGSVDRDVSSHFKICYGIMELENQKPLFYHREI